MWETRRSKFDSWRVLFFFFFVCVFFSSLYVWKCDEGFIYFVCVEM